jgi:O-acetyl-ADP-ribose deacetylase (regulator of RNase III)
MNATTVLKEVQGNLLNVSKGVICQQVNLQGVMGKGLALDIRTAYPVVYRRYKAALKKGLSLGDVVMVPITNELWVANIVGQEKIKGFGKPQCQTDYGAVRLGLEYIRLWQEFTESEIYIPYGMGCRLGGGQWEIVSKIIEEELPNAIIVKYEPSNKEPNGEAAEI